MVTNEVINIPAKLVCTAQLWILCTAMHCTCLFSCKYYLIRLLCTCIQCMLIFILYFAEYLLLRTSLIKAFTHPCRAFVNAMSTCKYTQADKCFSGLLRNEKNETLSEKTSRFSGIVVYKLFDVYTKEAVWADGGKFDNRRVEDAHNREKSGRQLWGNPEDKQETKGIFFPPPTEEKNGASGNGWLTLS